MAEARAGNTQGADGAADAARARLAAARDYARQMAAELVAGRVWHDEDGRELEFPPLGDPTRAHIVSYTVIADVLDRAL
ncbi:hypothetical protein [Streptomyces lunalinharesii]|uniref:Uncharacterized protein n=1 Tax=Streptomyces lunalinharesii TaxID=333384 RepID=A0ABP6EW82_9ACTN